MSSPAPIWTRSTPPPWPIFCRFSFSSHLHNSYNLSRASTTTSIIVSKSSVQANYTTTFSDLSNFSWSLSFGYNSDLAVWHSNIIILEELDGKKSCPVLNSWLELASWTQRTKLEWAFHIKFLFPWTEICTWPARTRLTYTTILSRAIKT